MQSRQSALQSELEAAEARAEEEAENANQAQQQLAKTNAELAALRSKHEREVAELQNEIDEAKYGDKLRLYLFDYYIEVKT